MSKRKNGGPVPPAAREYLARIGAKGGKATSAAKRRAVAQNGQEGGRPRSARWYVRIANQHAAADEACGRRWDSNGCRCGACRAARDAGHVPPALRQR